MCLNNNNNNNQNHAILEMFKLVNLTVLGPLREIFEL